MEKKKTASQEAGGQAQRLLERMGGCEGRVEEYTEMIKSSSSQGENE